MTEQEQREYNVNHGLAVLADDGCPHHDDRAETFTVTLPRRPFIGLRPAPSKKQARDMRPYYPTSIGTLVELTDGIGVFGEVNKSPELWHLEPVKLPDGEVFGHVLLVFINTKKPIKFK